MTTMAANRSKTLSTNGFGASMRKTLGVSPTLISLVVGALLWELVGRVADVAFFPPLSVVLERLSEMVVSGAILGPLASSLLNLVIGFGLSLAVGLVLGVLMGWYPKVDAALSMYVYAMLAAPGLVFAPIFFSIFGDGRGSIVAVVVTYALFIIIINTADAVRGVQPSLVEMGRSYGASERQILLKIVVPAALPMMMAGIRLGAGRAVTGMINGEMFIAVVGLGAIVTDAGGRFDAPSVLAVLLVIIVVALGSVGLVQAADNRLTSWLPKTTRE